MNNPPQLSEFRLTGAQVELAAKARRPGFAEAVRKNAKVDGEFLIVQATHWHALTRYFVMPIKPTPKGIGLGDVVASVAQPIARVIDGVVGTNLANCGGCADRKDALNRIRL